jgi:hypothetical protein
VPWIVYCGLGNWTRDDYKKPTVVKVIEFMKDSRQPVGDFFDQLAPFRCPGDGLPSLDEPTSCELNEVTFDEYDPEMLKIYDELGELTYLSAVQALELVQIAGRLGWTLAEAHRRLARLVPIGLKLEYPRLDFPDEIVYWYDLLALTTYFDGQEPVISGSIDQAYLEHAAEEIFDATPEQIPEKAALLRERLRIYQPLFRFELDVPREAPVD